MTNFTITTPSGYTVTLKTSLTFGEYEDIQDVITDNIELDAETGKPKVVNFKLLKQSNTKALEFLLVSITKDGEEFKGTIRDLPAKDGSAIIAEVNRITKEATPDEKKS